MSMLRREREALSRRIAVRMRFERKKATQHIVLDRFGAPSGARTRDTLIKSQVLYQLS